MLTPAKTFLGAAVWITAAAAWNTDVHNQIGFMAETFLYPETLSILADILEPQYNGSIGRAAAWADGYAHTTEGRFSYQWHWIDTHDFPPQHCSLNYTGDCAEGGCVVSAIANQTGILKGCIDDVRAGTLTGGSNLTCSYALKWVSHFLGDIAQPLHASGRAAGGNFYRVKFANHSTELHAVWDGYIPYYAAEVEKPFSNYSIDPFFEHLASRIRKDGFYEAPYMWIACSDPSTPVECATTWATESNKWTCDYVYRRLHGDEDLGYNGYADGAVPIVELQISKAAYRLATWLNKLVGEKGPSLLDQEVLELTILLDRLLHSEESEIIPALNEALTMPTDQPENCCNHQHFYPAKATRERSSAIPAEASIPEWQALCKDSSKDALAVT